MKKIKFLPLIMLMFVVGCAAQKNSKSFDELLYKAQTRGTHISIKVVQDELTYSKNGQEKVVKLSDEQKEQLSKLMNGLSYDSLIDLQAPSEKRITDGALHGEFVIVHEGNEYKSCGFDAGNPPKELKELEDFLYKIAE